MQPKLSSRFSWLLGSLALLIFVCVIAMVARASYVYGQQHSPTAACETAALQARIEQLESQLAEVTAIPEDSVLLYAQDLPDNAGDALSLAEWRQRLSINPGAARDLPPGWPVRQGYVSSMFGKRNNGRRHDGIDIVAPAGTPIYAVAEGRVVHAERRGAYGKLIDIRHPDGSVTRYAHSQENLVKPGTDVKAGQLIAKVGATGNASTAHLHFELLRDNQAVDPLAYLLTLQSNTTLAELELP